MRKLRDTEGGRKLRAARLIITELIIMAISVFVSIMPMPYRLIVPIIIGARSILLKAHAQSKAPPPAVVHCCGAANEKKKERTNDEKIKKSPRKIAGQAKTKTAGKAVRKKAARKDGDA